MGPLKSSLSIIDLFIFLKNELFIYLLLKDHIIYKLYFYKKKI